MASNKTPAGKLAGIRIHEALVNGGATSSPSLAQVKNFSLDGTNSKRSTTEPVPRHHTSGERMSTNTVLSTTRNDTRKPRTIPNHDKHFTTSGAAPYHSSPENLRIIRLDMIMNTPAFKHRVAAANEDNDRRLAIDAAMRNLGHCYHEAVELVATLKERGMDLVEFIEKTRDAKERSKQTRAHGSVGMGHGGSGDRIGEHGDKDEDQMTDGYKEENGGDVDGDEDVEAEEWRLWLE